MGFKFGGTSFTVGIVTININSIDTDRMTCHFVIEAPIADGKLSLNLSSGINWSKARNFNVDVTFRQNDPPEETEDSYDGGDEDNEEEST